MGRRIQKNIPLRIIGVCIALLCIFTSCGKRREIHFQDRQIQTYRIINRYIKKGNPPVLVILAPGNTIAPGPQDTFSGRFDEAGPFEKVNSDNWAGKLLAEKKVSEIYWVPKYRMEEAEIETDQMVFEKTFPSMSPDLAESIKTRIHIIDMVQLASLNLSGGIIASLDLMVAASEDGIPPGEFLPHIIKWMNTEKPELISVSMSSGYQKHHAAMYGYLYEIVSALSGGMKLYLHSEAPPAPEHYYNAYWQQHWPKQRNPGSPRDFNIRPDPWLWYSLPGDCASLLLEKKCIIEGDYGDAILSIWKDQDYRKLQEKFDDAAMKEIINSARRGIFDFWEKGIVPALPQAGNNEGIAVRLLVEGKDRGCLSWYTKTGDIREFAAYCGVSALGDPRYTAIAMEESGDMLIELSVFGPWEDIDTCEDFIPGFHNLRLINGVYDTILQAPLVSQRAYSKEDFLDALCRKAGLEASAWRDNQHLRWQRSSCLWYTEPL